MRLDPIYDDAQIRLSLEVPSILAYTVWGTTEEVSQLTSKNGDVNNGHNFAES